MQAHDLTGQQFTNLTVVSEAPKRHPKRKNWNCVCVCGEHLEVDTSRLRTGNTKSCGCLRKQNCSALGKKSNFKTEPGEAGFRNLFRKYKGAASDRGHEFCLTEMQFKSLTQSDCHYCGCAPSRMHRSSHRNDSSRERTAYVFNGVDRIDSNIGYLVENCVPACTDCNFAKQSLSYTEFLALISRIFKHRIGA